MRKALLGALSSVLLAGCVTREDIRGIQTDLYTIQQGLEKRLGSVKDQTDSVQTSQADLLQEMRDLRGDISILQTELRDYQQRMGQMASRLDDLEASLTARMDTQIELLSGSKFVEKPLPSTVFNLANTDFARGKHSEAIRGFENYLKQFPKGEKTAEARLKIGDSHLKQKDSSAAIQAYDHLIQNYPKDSLVPTALLRKAAALENLGKSSEAAKIYSNLLKDHPSVPEARTAQEKLRALQTPSQP